MQVCVCVCVYACATLLQCLLFGIVMLMTNPKANTHTQMNFLVGYLRGDGAPLGNSTALVNIHTRTNMSRSVFVHIYYILLPNIFIHCAQHCKFIEVCTQVDKRTHPSKQAVNQ